MIVELVKAAVFIFPFIKELFLGKDKDKDAAKKDKDPKATPAAPEQKEPARKGHFLRQTLITVAILSVIVNVTLMEKLYKTAAAMLTLKKEVATYKAAPQQPTAQGIEATTVQPVDPTTPTPSVPPAPTPPNIPEALPPRDEHTQVRQRVTHDGVNRRAIRPNEDRTAEHNDRLRRINEIK